MWESDPQKREQEDDCGLIGPINSESLVLAGTIGLPQAFPLTLTHQRRADANNCRLQRERQITAACGTFAFTNNGFAHKTHDI